MGGASVLVLVAGFFRTKIIAVLIGPEGVGLAGSLVNFNNVLAMLVGWGLATSGVRMIASATPAERPQKVAAVLSFGYRLMGLSLLAALVLSWPVAWYTFAGTEGHALEMALASLGVPCLVGAGVWGAILQAEGHLKPLARTQVLSAFAGLLIGIPVIYGFKQAGWPLIGIAGGILIAMGVPAWLTYRAAKPYYQEAQGIASTTSDRDTLIKLGGALMLVGLMSQLSAYISRLVVIRQLGLEAAGHYQAALAIASSLPSFVFAAMATDFFPRVAAARDENEAQHLVEKQIQAGLLLALPFLTALLTMGRLCIHWLYAAQHFEPAIPILALMIWGVFLRLVSWPIGFWLQARGSSHQVIIIELISNIIIALLPVLLVSRFGLEGAAGAYAGGYLAYAVLMYFVLRWRTGRWLGSATCLFVLGSAVALGLAQYCPAYIGGDFWGIIPSGFMALVSALIYYQTMKQEAKS
jgi:PST family polysaccharide transporter